MKAVLFDFWGTVVENGVFPSPVKQAKFILRLNVSFGEYIDKFEESFMTRQFESLTDAFNNVTKTFNVRPPAFVIEKLVGMWNKNTLLAKPFPETIETIKELKEKGYKIALVSNTDPFSVNQVMDKFQMRDLFDTIVLSYEEGMLKSNPDMFEKALHDLGVSKEEAIMVGDSIESDMEGAKRAGIRGILVDRRNAREFDDKITSLKDVENILEGKPSGEE